MKTSIKMNRSNEQKDKFARAAHYFFLLAKLKQIRTCSTLFCLFLPLFCTTTMPFCKTKTSNFLVTHYFYGGIVARAYQRFCFPCSCSLLFFHCRLFSPCWLLVAFLIFLRHRRQEIFMFFSQRHSIPFF